MHFITGDTIQALCWTLIHSLWQGILLAIIAGIVIMRTKRSAVVLRYNLLAGLLLAFIFIAAGTFYLEFNNIPQKATPGTLVLQQVNEVRADYVTGQATTNNNNTNLLTIIAQFLSANAGIIVLVWLFIISWKCVRLMAGLSGMYMLKYRNTACAGEYWNNRIKELAAGLRINTRIQLLQSAIAKVPMVLGHFKPVILVPAGILTSLPADEIEAILLHELAHIKRKDYLVNLLQNICEIFFFFNPAVLWLSSLIKEERENCCDEMALAKVKNKDQFIHALVSFQEYNLADARYAVALKGNNGHLFNRVKRILTNNNKTLNTMEKSLLATGMVVISFVAIAFSQAKEAPVQNKKEVAVKLTQVTPVTTVKLVEVPDTLPLREKSRLRSSRSTFTITSTRDGKDYEIVGEGEYQIIRLYIDGVRIPDDKVADYKGITDQIIKESKEQAKEARREAEISKRHAEESSERAEREKEYAEESVRHSERSKERAEQNARLAEIDNEHAERSVERAERSRIDEYRSAKRAEREKERAEASMERAEISKVRSEEAYRRAEISRERAEVSRMRADESRKKTEVLIESIINDLTSEGIIKSAETLTFSINSKELIVNGVKQPDGVHSKFKEKFLKSESDNINFSRNKNSKHSSISINRNNKESN